MVIIQATYGISNEIIIIHNAKKLSNCSSKTLWMQIRDRNPFSFTQKCHQVVHMGICLWCAWQGRSCIQYLCYLRVMRLLLAIVTFIIYHSQLIVIRYWDCVAPPLNWTVWDGILLFIFPVDTIPCINVLFRHRVIDSNVCPYTVI